MKDPILGLSTCTIALACACAGDFMMEGGFGATAGGVQDMGLARELIEEGMVPPPEAFVVEGMFSEHDLPLDGPACTSLLCLRAAAGVAPTLDGEDSAWLQVGLSSSVDPTTFQREPQTLVMAIDASGSMGSRYEDVGDGHTSPMEVSRALLHAIVAELGPSDQVALVTYGSKV
ncbi:MAG: VWA domain-containing protein, partial [Polyangia bacterium]